jgi:hypothetical protein
MTPEHTLKMALFIEDGWIQFEPVADDGWACLQLTPEHWRALGEPKTLTLTLGEVGE